jgi:hypothetical protein
MAREDPTQFPSYYFEIQINANSALRALHASNQLVYKALRLCSARLLLRACCCVLTVHAAASASDGIYRYTSAGQDDSVPCAARKSWAQLGFLSLRRMCLSTLHGTQHAQLAPFGYCCARSLTSPFESSGAERFEKSSFYDPLLHYRFSSTGWD